MIRLIVRVGKWLDARFPVKVVLTQDDLEQMRSDIIGAREIRKVQADILQAQEFKIEELRQSISAIKDLITKAAQAGAQAAAKSRAEYIASGRMGE